VTSSTDPARSTRSTSSTQSRRGGGENGQRADRNGSGGAQPGRDAGTGSGWAQRWREGAESAVDAAQKVVPGANLVNQADPASFGGAMARLAGALLTPPWPGVGPWTRYLRDLGEASAVSMRRAVGAEADGPVKPPPGDRRFADPTWDSNAWYFWLRQQHLLLERLTAELVESVHLDEPTRQKAGFLVKQLVDAAAPTNFFWGNPAAIKRAFETGGLSVARGTRNFLQDVATNRGQPRQVVPGRFKVGKDLAATPGKVVFRNSLMELIQYAPQTDTVHEVPLLLSPPWINKYYMMDLAPGRSLVEWAVQHGHTVFVISYRNPTAEMRDCQLDDYLVNGPQIALDVIEDITGSEEVNLLGLCLGGTLTMCTLAYLDATGDRRVRTATLLNTLVDFSEPGQLGIFTDKSTVERLERRMERSGFLPGESMRATFDLLRSNDLIWSYAVNNWLMGQDPPPFDLLAWNADSTRMPAGMHSFYLRSCYLDNELAQGVMELAGQRLDLGAVSQDLYFVAAEQDHIAPWRSVYKGSRLPKGQVRLVLSNSGHIAGVVNPPNPKSKFWASEDGELPPDPDVWRSRAVEHKTSWWEDWTPWVAERAGAQRKPPPMGSKKHPVVADAPGTYVHET
jgi:polyhydroxyalkanoate synthase